MPSIDETLAKARDEGDVRLQPCPYLTSEYDLAPPYRVAILHFLMRGRIVLRDPVGVGKTACALGSYAYFRRNRHARLLVLTTDTAQWQWQAEVHRLTTFSARLYGYDRRTPLSPEARRTRYKHSTDPTDVWVTTYGTAARDVAVLLQHPYILVFDEVQILRGSGQSRVVGYEVKGGAHGKPIRKMALLHPAAKVLSKRAVCCWALSATPYMKRIEDVHGVFDAVVPGLLGTRFEFTERYVHRIDIVRKDGRKFPKVIGTKNVKELTDRIAPYTLQRTEAQVGQYLPKVLPLRRVDVEMGAKQRALYDQLWGAEARAAHTEVDRLRAVLHAQMVTDAPAVLGHTTVPSAKWEALKELLTGELDGQQVLIYTFFATVAQWLKAQCEGLGIPTGIITGTMTSPKRFDTQQAFQAGKARIVILTSAGIYGVNLKAPVFVFYDLPWIWGDSVQAVGRARRRAVDSPGTLLVLAVVARSSINEHTVAVLRQSQEANRRIFDPLKKSSKTLSNMLDPLDSSSTTNNSTSSASAVGEDPSVSKVQGDLSSPDLETETIDTLDTLFGRKARSGDAAAIDALFEAEASGLPAAETLLPTFTEDDVP